MSLITFICIALCVVSCFAVSQYQWMFSALIFLTLVRLDLRCLSSLLCTSPSSTGGSGGVSPHPLSVTVVLFLVSEDDGRVLTSCGCRCCTDWLHFGSRAQSSLLLRLVVALPSLWWLLPLFTSWSMCTFYSPLVIRLCIISCCPFVHGGGCLSSLWRWWLLSLFPRWRRQHV